QKLGKTLCHAEEIPASSVCCIQSVWEVPVIQHTLFDHTISTNTAEDKARLLAAHSIPSSITSVAIRLGADVCQTHRCPCGAAVSAKGLDVLACKLSRGRISRHDRLPK
ncbi:hypothetical protein ILUMI_02263, partial [Ignelater luminosus]